MKSLIRSFALCGLLASSLAHADVVTFLGSGTGPGGVPVSASAMFSLNNAGNTLTITLTNTSVANNLSDVPGSTLTGLFWTSTKSLTTVSATVAAGAIIGTCDLVASCGTNVGGEFGYQQAASFSGGPANANRGISSSGYLTTGLPGNLGNFNGIDLDQPESLDGINFGIISAASGYNPNGGLESVPVIKDTVTFVLSGTGLKLTDFTNVSFQYGTAFSELNIPGNGDPDFPDNSVPEPSGVALLGAGLIGMLLARRYYGAALLRGKSRLARTGTAPMALA